MWNEYNYHTYISALKWQPSMKSFRLPWRSVLRATKHNILTHFDIPSQHLFLKTINYRFILYSLKLGSSVVQYFTQPFSFKLIIKQVMCKLIVYHPSSFGNGGKENGVKPESMLIQLYKQLPSLINRS